jgi:hypothetical protein
LADNVEQVDNFVNGGGGIVFTSGEGQGQETRSGYNADKETENIDLLLSVIDMAKTAAGGVDAAANPVTTFLEGFGSGLSTIQALKTGVDEAPGAFKEVKDALGPSKPTRAVCAYCGDTIPTQDTARARASGAHKGDFKPVP